MMDAMVLAKELVALIKQHELDQAERKAAAALEQMSQESFVCRGAAINAVNIELQRLVRQRALLRAAILELPAEERIFVEVQIEAIVDKIYEPAITAMKKQKRAFARPTKA